MKGDRCPINLGGHIWRYVQGNWECQACGKRATSEWKVLA